MEKDNKQQLHAGHRERMRERFLSTDGSADSGFKKHELLEMLLFFSVKRQNTNETAHRLLDEFGSMRGVFNAPYDALKDVTGVGACSAFLIRLVSALIHSYIEEPNRTGSTLRLSRTADAVPYLRNLFFGYTNELVYLLLFDSRCILIDAQRLSVGTEGQVTLDEFTTVRAAINKKAAFAILAHNHPSGTLAYSDDDLQFTIRMERAFNAVGICLLEHYIITEDAHMGIIEVRNRELTKR